MDLKNLCTEKIKNVTSEFTSRDVPAALPNDCDPPFQGIVRCKLDQSYMSHLTSLADCIKKLEIKSPFLNTFFIRGVVPLTILYIGLKHCWRNFSVSKCFKYGYHKFKRQGKLSSCGALFPDLPFFLFSPIPPMRRVVFSNPTQKVALKLVDKRYCTHDTRKFVFELPWNCADLGIPIGYYCIFSAMIDGEEVSRPYAPITISDPDDEVLEFGIKIHSCGKMSQYLDKLPLGTMVDMSGPVGSFNYRGNSIFNVNFPRNPETFVKESNIIGLIIAGTGIFRVIPLLKAFCEEGEDSPCVKMLYANLTEEDIKEKDFLEVLQAESDFLNVVHVIEKETVYVPAVQGVVCLDLIRREMPPPCENPLFFVFGPPDMVCNVSRDLINLGYPYSRIVNW